MPSFHFELPIVLIWGLPLVLVVLVVTVMGLASRGLLKRRLVALVALRLLALVGLVLLLARPVAVESQNEEESRSVALLLDRSKSMSLLEAGGSRYERQLELAQTTLVPALEEQGWRVETYLFADDAYPVDIGRLDSTLVDGPRSDLGGAVVHALRGAADRPLAVIALSDGVATETSKNRDALLGLVDDGIPFIGIGVGDDEGVASLSLERLSGPTSVPPDQVFKLSARLQAVGEGEMPAFDLVLLRNGEMVRTKHVPARRGSRIWSESFEVSESAEGLHEYTVEMMAPTSAELVTVSSRASAPVKVTEEKTFRVLFAQGALTWNFKFIGRALRGDPTISLTGLSRTSEQSMFRQNVENAGELLDGFPDELTDLAPYRVLILSELGPADLTPRQQETIARFVGELGGGLLMIGGVATFNAFWQGSRLESLLPVTFDEDPGVLGLDSPFHLTISSYAARHPVFQVDDEGASREVWENLPTFTHYGRVRKVKRGATVWARHSHDTGSISADGDRGAETGEAADRRRVLMASQYYGAGVSAVVTVQNLWRWRLARESEPAHFDRFWKQLLRYLGQAGGQEISIQVLDQERSPGSEVRALVERRPRPESNQGDEPGSAEGRSTIRVEDPEKKVILEQEARLDPLRPVEIRFQADLEGVYSVQVMDGDGVQLASRPLEIKNVDVEMKRTGRDLENLRQWASLTQGLAMPIEECRDMEQLTSEIGQRVEALRKTRDGRVPVGVNGWVLGLLLAFLGGEWALRKRWGLP